MAQHPKPNDLIRSLPREFRKLAQQALRQGWRIKLTQNKHSQWFAPDGVNIVTIAGSSGGGRGDHNARAQLKRFGL